MNTNADQWCWPDGGNYYDQDHLTTEIFGVVKNEINEMRREKDGKK
jgi:hypothetical protein